MPTREIHKHYTKSEMAVIAWRSSETVYHMSSNRPQLNHAQGNGQEHPFQGKDYALPDREFQALEDRLGEAIVTAMVDDQGEIDLKRLTGPQALHFLQSMGLPFAPGIVRNSMEAPDVVAAHKR